VGEEEVSRSPLPTPDRLPRPYTQPHQARRHPPTDYENLLGDAIEAAFTAGHWELDALVAKLNEDGIRTPDGEPWTLERFKAVMAALADQ
jgi:hypothetical protein